MEETVEMEVGQERWSVLCKHGRKKGERKNRLCPTRLSLLSTGYLSFLCLTYADCRMYILDLYQSTFQSRLASPFLIRSLLLILLGSFLPTLLSFIPLPFNFSSSSSYPSRHRPPPPPFHIPPYKFRSDPLPVPAPSSFLVPPDLLPPRSADGGIPNIVHYVFGYKEPKEGEEGGELFPYYAYLAVRSAIVNLEPERVFL